MIPVTQAHEQPIFSSAHLHPQEQLELTEARIASLRVLAMSLLREIEKLEEQNQEEALREVNLQQQVHAFEESLIRCALEKTGGRQRRAARLLGVKVTTLNTKIKRYKINTA